MNTTNMKTPGVYIDELNAFPGSVVPVPTAVPAFIGYTPQAMNAGKSVINQAQKIGSFKDFQSIYCFPDPSPPQSPAKQYNPQYYLVQQKTVPAKGDELLINGVNYSIVPDPNTIYYLYNSVKLFYENGGGDAYIVSVGGYGAPSNIPLNPGDRIVNPNVQLNDLLAGLAILKKEQEPTMYICPEATLVSVENNGKLMRAMLQQCADLQTAISVFDIIGGNAPDPNVNTNDISTFRDQTGTVGLSYGTAYYPFIGTSIMQSQDIDYTNLFGGDIKQLEPIINPANNPNSTVAAILANIQNPSGTLTVTQNNNALINASPVYSTIIGQVLATANILPPSGGMAGVITTIDNEEGPWKAPANVSIVGAESLTIQLSDSQQAYLNTDVVSGKSVNAIRFFNGIGILVWGARTLAGNDAEWRYLPVRRNLMYIEQSCKLATQAYVFEPNTVNTWVAVKATLENFLTSVWRSGGLQGAKPTDAFSVECGLGTTMTAEDILNGYMNVSVCVAPLRPAEFIVISFRQLVAKSS